MLRTLMVIILMGAGVFAMPDSSVLQDKQTIEHMIRQKETSVNQHNKQLFISLLDPHNKMYLQEQKHWFDDAVVYIDSGSYRLKPLKIQAESKNNIIVWVSVQYTHKGKRFNVEYPLCFRKIKEGWRDADVAFFHNTKEHFTVYYTDDTLQKQAEIALKTLQRATVAFEERYQWSPKKVEVKIYHQPEVFRQSVKPSLPGWAGGWHESKQAIKFIGGIIDDASFSRGIVHELTHQMVSEMTNDNAAYWLQEGAAMYYERHLLGDKEEKLRNDSLYTLSQLEKMNLEKLPDREAGRYYVSCYYLFDSLVRTYGEKHIGKMLSTLSGYPEMDVESAQKIDTLNERTRRAMGKDKVMVDQ